MAVDGRDDALTVYTGPVLARRAPTHMHVWPDAGWSLDWID